MSAARPRAVPFDFLPWANGSVCNPTDEHFPSFFGMAQNWLTLSAPADFLGKLNRPLTLLP